ncbi:hypothetical protein MMC30_008355 [Trapelia coarctata]|nr:hypothetical protein [Trapelia coarctata]
MLSTNRIFLLAVLLPLSLNPGLAWPPDIPICYNELYSVENIADCYSAIDLIPAGFSIDHSRFHPKEPYPITVRLSAADRRRKILLPAAFNAGRCLILVQSTTNPSDVHPPKNAATAMHLSMWPNVKRLAQKVVDKCLLTTSHLLGHQGGEVEGESTLEKHRFAYKITVRAKPRFWDVSKREGQQAQMRMVPRPAGDPTYNLYEAVGAVYPAVAA